MISATLLVTLVAGRAVDPPLFPALTTLDALLEPISRELKTPVVAGAGLGKRLVYCRTAPQSATDRLVGLAKALDLEIEQNGGTYRLRARRPRTGTVEERMVGYWESYVALVGSDADGDAADVQRRRLALDQQIVQDVEQKSQNTPAGRARLEKAAALMRLETPAKLLLFNAMRRTRVETLVAPYGKVPSTSQWVTVPPEQARAAELGKDPAVLPLLERPGALAVARPVWDRDRLDWRLIVLVPEGYLTVGSIEIEQKGSVTPLKHDLPTDLDALRLELRLDRPHDDFLTLGSVATALSAKGKSFAAWCPSEYLIFRAHEGTLRAFEEEPRRSPQFRFLDQGSGWVGVRIDPAPSVTTVGIDWSKALPLLDRYDRGTLDLASLRQHLKALDRSQLAALANVRYETQNLGQEYYGLTEGAALLRAALCSDWDPARDGPTNAEPVRTLPGEARDIVHRFLSSGRFVQDFPALFHPNSALDVDQFVLERRIEGAPGAPTLTVGLRSSLGTQRTLLSQYRLTLAASPGTPRGVGGKR